MNIKNIFKNFIIKTKKGVTREEINNAEKKYGWVLPDFYREILIFSNGIYMDSVIGEENTIILLGIEEIYEDNKNLYETSLYLPGFLVIGCTGGEEILVVEQKKEIKKIYIYDADMLFPNEATFIVINIEKWFLNGCPMDKDIYYKTMY